MTLSLPSGLGLEVFCVALNAQQKRGVPSVYEQRRYERSRIRVMMSDLVVSQMLLMDRLKVGGGSELRRYEY